MAGAPSEERSNRSEQLKLKTTSNNEKQMKTKVKAWAKDTSKDDSTNQAQKSDNNKESKSRGAGTSKPKA